MFFWESSKSSETLPEPSIEPAFRSPYVSSFLSNVPDTFSASTQPPSYPSRSNTTVAGDDIANVAASQGYRPLNGKKSPMNRPNFIAAHHQERRTPAVPGVDRTGGLSNMSIPPRDGGGGGNCAPKYWHDGYSVKRFPGHNTVDRQQLSTGYYSRDNAPSTSRPFITSSTSLTYDDRLSLDEDEEVERYAALKYGIKISDYDTVSDQGQFLSLPGQSLMPESKLRRSGSIRYSNPDLNLLVNVKPRENLENSDQPNIVVNYELRSSSVNTENVPYSTEKRRPDETTDKSGISCVVYPRTTAIRDEQRIPVNSYRKPVISGDGYEQQFRPPASALSKRRDSIYFLPSNISQKMNGQLERSTIVEDSSIMQGKNGFTGHKLHSNRTTHPRYSPNQDAMRRKGSLHLSKKKSVSHPLLFSTNNNINENYPYSLNFRDDNIVSKGSVNQSMESSIPKRGSFLFGFKEPSKFYENSYDYKKKSPAKLNTTNVSTVRKENNHKNPLLRTSAKSRASVSPILNRDIPASNYKSSNSNNINKEQRSSYSLEKPWQFSKVRDFMRLFRLVFSRESYKDSASPDDTAFRRQTIQQYCEFTRTNCTLLFDRLSNGRLHFVLYLQSYIY